MTQAALAKRLGLATSTISRMQSKSNFSEWSQQRDPEKIVGSNHQKQSCFTHKPTTKEAKKVTNRAAKMNLSQSS